MPYIVVTLGLQFVGCEGCPQHLPISVQVDVPTLEIDPEDVFLAGNRLEDLNHDVSRLPQVWQKSLRLTLDLVQAPSMSTLDTIAMYSTSGDLLGTWKCEIIGWTKLLPERTRA